MGDMTLPPYRASRLHERISRLLARWAGIRAYRFFTRPLNPLAAPYVPGGIELRLLGEAALLPLCARPELELNPANLAAALGRGDLCAGAFHDGELVGYCWFAFAALPHLDGVWVDFHRDGVWMYKSLVLPSYRGRGIAPALYHFTDAACAQRGRTFSISCVETHNRPSIAAKRDAYAPAGYAAWLRRERKLVFWASRRARDLARFYLP